MEKLHLAYIDNYAANQYAFIPMPYLIIRHPAYKALGYGEKILYTLMLNRLSLSNQAGNKERFCDDRGRVYIIYTVNQVMDDMACAKATAIKFLDNLTEIGLIERIRQGQGKPSITYIKDFASIQNQLAYGHSDANNMTSEKEVSEVQNLDFKKSKFYTSRSSKTRPLEVQKLDPSYINNSYINNSYINNINNNLSINLGKHNNIKLAKEHMDSLIEEYGSGFEKLIDEVSERIFARSQDAPPITNYYKYIKTVAGTLGIMTVTELIRTEKIKKQKAEEVQLQEQIDTNNWYERKMEEYGVSTREDVDKLFDEEMENARKKLLPSS